MQATAAPPDAATKLRQRREAALDTLHTIMLHLTASITAPNAATDEEEPPQARTATQRIRLCIQAAREILRNVPPTDADDPEREDAPTTRPRRKPGRTPTDTRTTQTRVSAPPNAQPLLAAAGTGVSRFGERLSPSRDSSLVAHTSPPSAPSVPSASSVVNSSSPAPSPNPQSETPNPQSPPPPYFTKEEFRAIIAIQQNKPQRLTPHLYARILEWNRYAIPLGMSPALGISAQALEALKPLDDPPATQAPPPS